MVKACLLQISRLVFYSISLTIWRKLIRICINLTNLWMILLKVKFMLLKIRHTPLSNSVFLSLFEQSVISINYLLLILDLQACPNFWSPYVSKKNYNHTLFSRTSTHLYTYVCLFSFIIENKILTIATLYSNRSKFTTSSHQSKIYPSI